MRSTTLVAGVGALLLFAFVTACAPVAQDSSLPSASAAAVATDHPTPSPTFRSSPSSPPTTDPSASAGFFPESVAGFDLAPIDGTSTQAFRSAVEASIGEDGTIGIVEGAIATAPDGRTAEVYVFTVVEAGDPTGQDALAAILDANGWGRWPQ